MSTAITIEPIPIGYSLVTINSDQGLRCVVRHQVTGTREDRDIAFAVARSVLENTSGGYSAEPATKDIFNMAAWDRVNDNVVIISKGIHSPRLKPTKTNHA